ncbi:MAG: hypothetical protein U5L00_02540 [Desulfovermiculus sp.]|nr:hypothetical protein [Desulfovermiculus sp.]
MIIGYFQYSPDFATPADNLCRVEDTLSGIEVDIVVLPELAFNGQEPGFYTWKSPMTVTAGESDVLLPPDFGKQ